MVLLILVLCIVLPLTLTHPRTDTCAVDGCLFDECLDRCIKEAQPENPHVTTDPPVSTTDPPVSTNPPDSTTYPPVSPTDSTNPPDSTTEIPNPLVATEPPVTTPS